MRALMLIAVVTAVALGACRREEAEPEYRPLKLGGPTEQAAPAPSK
jgi:hypothetical protein